MSCAPIEDMHQVLKHNQDPGMKCKNSPSPSEREI